MSEPSSAHGAWPFMERPPVAFLLALVAGVLSGFTFYTVSLFSTVQSGNVVQVGFQLAAHRGVRWEHAVVAILAFGCGSAATAIVQIVLADRSTPYAPVILVLEALVLFAMGSALLVDRWSPLTYAYIVSFLAGMQGNAFHRLEGQLYGNVAVTLVVQMAFDRLARALVGDRRTHLLQSALFFFILGGFALGGYAGAWGTQTFDQQILWLPASILVVTAILSVALQWCGEPVDSPA